MPDRRNSYPPWAPRIWHGIAQPEWWGLLRRHRFAIHPFRWVLAAGITVAAAGNSLAAVCQRWKYGRAIADTQLPAPPIFIVGHWRSGTTFLHELLIQDPRFTFPTTYECFAPRHFLTSSWFTPRILRWLLPATRPMDDMPNSFDHPQEDEFALCLLGAPSPYAFLAFPNHAPEFLEFLDLAGVSPEGLELWKRSLDGFVRAVTYLRPKRLVLKSPTHTGRIGVLSEMFPGAKFVHLVRHPSEVFLSTRKLWRALTESQGLQLPHHRGLDEFIFTCCERMYRGFSSQRPSLAEGQLVDVRYEDLVREPLGELARIYDALDLREFADATPRFQDFLRQRADYRAGRYELEDALEAEIFRRWGSIHEPFGYQPRNKKPEA